MRILTAHSSRNRIDVVRDKSNAARNGKQYYEQEFIRQRWFESLGDNSKSDDIKRLEAWRFKLI